MYNIWNVVINLLIALFIGYLIKQEKAIKGSGIPHVQGAWLAPRQLVQHAFVFLEKQGVQIKTSQKVTALSQTEQGWQINTAENETFCHEVVVLANGHKLTEFEQTQKLPLYPVRGQGYGRCLPSLLPSFL